MFCIYCAAATPNNSVFCRNCGRQFDRVMKTPAITCSWCRAANPNDAVFCWYCGRRLERESAAGLVLPAPLLGGAAGSGPASAGNVPMVQGTPQASGMPMLQGTPYASHSPLAEGMPSQLGHAATDAGHGLGLPGPVTGSGQGLGHAVTGAGQGLGHSSPSLPTQTPLYTPQTGVPSVPPGPAAHPPQAPTPTGHPGTPINPSSSTPPMQPTPLTSPAPHPMPPVYQPPPVQQHQKEGRLEHHHHRSEHGEHASHLAGSAPKAVLGLAPKWVLILVIGAVVVAGGIGGIYAITRSHTPGTGGAGGTSSTSSTPSAQYYIYSLNLSGPNIVIGTKSDIQRPSCNFTDGGLCHGGDPNVQVLGIVGGPYNTYAQAVAAYCQMVTNIHSAFGGTKGYINGVDYWLDNAPSC